MKRRKAADGYEETEILIDGKPLEAVLKSAGMMRYGRGFKAVWIRLAVEALKLRHASSDPNVTANAIAEQLDQLLIDTNQKQPAYGKLWELVDWVFKFDDNPLQQPPHPMKRTGNKEKGK